jgi:hypothetical protein
MDLLLLLLLVLAFSEGKLGIVTDLEGGGGGQVFFFWLGDNGVKGKRESQDMADSLI